MMNRRLIISLPLATALLLSICGASNAGEVWDDMCLSDSEFTDTSSMDKDEIQKFLEEHDSFLSENNLKDVDGHVIDPAQIIYDAALANRINPQVILTTLQKETDAVRHTTRLTDKWLRLIMGYGAPSTIRDQIADAAAQMRRDCNRLSKGNPTAGNWNVGVSKHSLDPLLVTPASKTVAILFSYTPWVGQDWGGRKLIGGNALFCYFWDKFGFGKKSLVIDDWESGQNWTTIENRATLSLETTDTYSGSGAMKIDIARGDALSILRNRSIIYWIEMGTHLGIYNMGMCKQDYKDHWNGYVYDTNKLAFNVTPSDEIVLHNVVMYIKRTNALVSGVVYVEVFDHDMNKIAESDNTCDVSEVVVGNTSSNRMFTPATFNFTDVNIPYNVNGFYLSLSYNPGYSFKRFIGSIPGAYSINCPTTVTCNLNPINHCLLVGGCYNSHTKYSTYTNMIDYFPILAPQWVTSCSDFEYENIHIGEHSWSGYSGGSLAGIIRIDDTKNIATIDKAVDCTNKNSISLVIKSEISGIPVIFWFGESDNNKIRATDEEMQISEADTWVEQTIDISGLTDEQKAGLKYWSFDWGRDAFDPDTGESLENTIYIDQLEAL